MRCPVPVLALAATLVASGLAGCAVPYSVGATAATAPVRTVVPAGIVQIASADRALETTDRATGAVATIGTEARFGLDPHSDVGVRVLGAGTFVTSYKRRLSGDGEVGTALLVGAGVVGLRWFHGEATLVRAWPARGQVTPYAGVRVQSMTPFAGDAAEVPPAVGVFAGGRIGWPDLAVSPEVGVFYSESPLRGDSPLLIVPSVTVHGDRLMRALGL